MKKKTYTLASALALLMLTANTACTRDEGNDTAPTQGTVLSATATLPQTVGSLTRSANGTRNGVATRSFGTGNSLSNLTLYYPQSKEANKTNTDATSLSSSYVVDDNGASVADDALSFTTTAGKFSGTGNPLPLYWQQIAGHGLTAQNFCLTVQQAETDLTTNATTTGDAAKAGIAGSSIATSNVLWGKAGIGNITGGNADSPRPAPNFGTLKSRFARLTLKIKSTGGTLAADNLTASIYAKAPAAADVANAGTDANRNSTTGIYRQAWPTTSDDAASTTLTLATASTSGSGGSGGSDNGTTDFAFRASHLLAPQAVPTSGDADAKMLLIEYNGKDAGGNNNITHTWKLDLSQVSVNRDADSPFASENNITDPALKGFAYGTAFGYNPGEHLTLTVTIALSELKPGEVESRITDFEAGTAEENNFDAGSASLEGGSQPGVNITLTQPVLSIAGIDATTRAAMTRGDVTTNNVAGITAIDLYIDLMKADQTVTKSTIYRYNNPGGTGSTGGTGNWTLFPGSKPLTVTGGAGIYYMRAAARVKVGDKKTMMTSYTGTANVKADGTFKLNGNLVPYTAAVVVTLKDKDGRVLDTSTGQGYSIAPTGIATTSFTTNDDAVTWTADNLCPAFFLNKSENIYADGAATADAYSLVPGTVPSTWYREGDGYDSSATTGSDSKVSQGSNDVLFTITKAAVSGGDPTTGTWTVKRTGTAQKLTLAPGKLYKFTITLDGRDASISSITAGDFEDAGEDDKIIIG